MIIGGIAVIARGVPRLTVDIGLTGLLGGAIVALSFYGPIARAFDRRPLDGG